MDTEEGQAAAELYRRGVLGGFSDGEFKGGRFFNRGEAAKMILLACNRKTDLPSPIAFLDVPPNQWFTKYVHSAAAQGILSGHPDGRFKPADLVQRDQFLKMLTLACNLPVDLPYTYIDVSPDDWVAPYAGTAEHYGLFDTFENYLEPATVLTRKDVAIALYRFLQKR